jgi:hypothetical protein
MAASPSSIVHDLKGTPNPFVKIHELVQKALDEKRKVLLILDIDGVQDEARLEVEKTIAKYLQKQNEAFKEYINKIVVPSVILLCAKLAREEFLQNIDPFKCLIEYILLPEIYKKDLEKIFSSLEQSREAMGHQHYLSYCELLKVLRKTELPASYDTVIAHITEKITSNTALICAMHLSTAICATSPLIVADKSDNAVEHLADLYQDFQQGNSKKNNSYVIQLTARTEAMASTYARLLEVTLAGKGIKLFPLEKQSLKYTNNAQRFGNYPTGTIPESNIIAASRNPKAAVAHEFLVQNELLSEPIHVFLVDDKAECLEDIKDLSGLPGAEKCTVETVLFDRNRTAEEKQALCARVAESLEKAGLKTAIEEYGLISKGIGDSAASTVIEHYVLPLLNEDIISQDKVVQALNSNNPPQQGIPSPRVWGDANQSTHFSLPPADKNKQQPTVTYAPQLH